MYCLAVVVIVNWLERSHKTVQEHLRIILSAEAAEEHCQQDAAVRVAETVRVVVHFL